MEFYTPFLHVMDSWLHRKVVMKGPILCVEERLPLFNR